MKLTSQLVSVLVFFGILLAVGVGQSRAQLEDPNASPSDIGSVVIGSLAPVLRSASGSDTIFFLYTGDTVSAADPRRIKINFYKADGTLESTGTVTLTAGLGPGLASASGFGVTSDGVAVLTAADAAGNDTTGHYSGSILLVDGSLGAVYERPLIMGRGANNNWTAFQQDHLGTYIQTADFTTRIHVLCPGNNSAGTDVSALTSRLNSLGNYVNNGTSSTAVTDDFNLSVFDSAGALVGTTQDISCAGANFQNKAATGFTSDFATGAVGTFEVAPRTPGPMETVLFRDVIVWRTISVVGSSSVFDERLQVRQ